MKIRINRTIQLLLISGAAILICETVLARAGGGGGFSGGGGGSGGSGGSGGGGDGAGIIIYLLIRLVIEKPLIGIPLVILAVVIFYFSAKNRHSAAMSRTIRRGHSAATSMRLHSELTKIGNRDPAFDPKAFIQRCGKLLPDIQYAWSNQDMIPVRHFISDGVFERFTLQIEIQRGSGIRNIMKDVQVTGARLVDADSDEFFDTIHMAVTAKAIDKLVTLEEERVVQGGNTPDQFTEIWTFLRRPGAKTLASPGLLEGFCPNCGTQLQLTTSTTCESCGALVNSGEYDWVLSEITQEEVWRAPRHAAIAGIDELRTRDPGFNTQAIEDRVSAIFWHHRAAEFFAKESLLKSVALPQFSEREQRFWVADENGRHRFYADAAVGSVDIAEVIPAQSPEDPDRVRVLVEWSGHRELARVPGFIKPQWHKSRLMRQEYILMRKQSVQSLTKAALTSLHCPGCGAPQVAESTGECSYCGLQQNDGSSSWVLEEVATFNGFAVQQPAHETPMAGMPVAATVGMQISVKEQEAMIQCLAAIMLADGEIDQREDRQLKKMATKHNIQPQRLYELVHQVQESEEVDIPVLEDWEERNNFFKGLVHMCLADGNVSQSERRILKSLTGRLGYSDVDINTMITKERAALYQASKQVIKASKKQGSCRTDATGPR